MTREEFNAEIQRLNNLQLSSQMTLLNVGHAYKQLCREWLRDHDELPEGFEGFDD